MIIASHLQSLAQSVNSLVLPDETNQMVRLDISQLLNPKDEMGYDHLAVYVKNDADNQLTNPIQGRYKVEDDFLVFTPYFPFEKGMTYIVRFKNHQSEAGYQYQNFQIGEKPQAENAKLLSIYPSADTLPENLLRFYFYFNTPMKKDQALQHIHLVDAEGNVDPKAFMEFKQELWSADGKRLTLLFDPGRIKRGVSTNIELGPALLEGSKYKLSVSGTWEDVYGQKLVATTAKEFVVGKAYREPIITRALVIQKPEVNTNNKLTINFDRIIDHALVQSMIQVVDEHGKLVDGYWKISKGEKSAHFVPSKQWDSGNYQMIFDRRLEDVAGNNLEGLLDQTSDTTNNDQLLNSHFVIR